MRRSGFIRKMLDGACGAVLWEGPSVLDGLPLVVIATSLVEKATPNQKTGDTINCWIIRRDLRPSVAAMSRQDESICGDCKFRATLGARRCYVHLGHVDNIYSTYLEGGYPMLPDSPAIRATLFADRTVRLGSYGDPAFVPPEVWRPIFDHARAWIGYTHAWKNPPHPALLRFLMASVDSAKERDQARELGWRTYRARHVYERLEDGEIVCPATEEGGQVSTCEECRLCDGAKPNDRRRDISVMFHGQTSRSERKWKGLRLLASFSPSSR